MPRGVWDRSKTKEQREAEKGQTKTTGTGRGRGARAAKAIAAAPTRQFVKRGQAVAHSNIQGTEGLKILENTLTHLTQARNSVSSGPTNQAHQKVISHIDDTIVRVVGKIENTIDTLFPEQEEHTISDEVQVSTRAAKNSNATAAQAPIPAPVAVAPVPFNPPPSV